MKKNLFLLVILIFSTITVLYFIKISNDHAECSEQMIESKESDGKVIIRKTHICKEKYNL